MARFCQDPTVAPFFKIDDELESGALEDTIYRPLSVLILTPSVNHKVEQTLLSQGRPEFKQNILTARA